MNDLDENQVENITLLKMRSATAMYGTRGANGWLSSPPKNRKQENCKLLIKEV